MIASRTSNFLEEDRYVAKRIFFESTATVRWTRAAGANELRGKGKGQRGKVRNGAVGEWCYAKNSM
jgi:hypothetical protein